MQRYASDQNAEEDTYEHRDKIRLVQSFHGVSQFSGEIVYIIKLADYCQAVAHLKTKIGSGEQVYTCTIHARDIELVGGMKTQ